MIWSDSYANVAAVWNYILIFCIWSSSWSAWAEFEIPRCEIFDEYAYRLVIKKKDLAFVSLQPDSSMRRKIEEIRIRLQAEASEKLLSPEADYVQFVRNTSHVIFQSILEQLKEMKVLHETFVLSREDSYLAILQTKKSGLWNQQFGEELWIEVQKDLEFLKNYRDFTLECEPVE